MMLYVQLEYKDLCGATAGRPEFAHRPPPESTTAATPASEGVWPESDHQTRCRDSSAQTEFIHIIQLIQAHGTHDLHRVS